MTRNVTVPRQVVWTLEVTGTPGTGILDHADGGLWESKGKWLPYPAALNKPQLLTAVRQSFPLTNFVDVFVGCR